MTKNRFNITSLIIGMLIVIIFIYGQTIYNANNIKFRNEGKIVEIPLKELDKLNKDYSISKEEKAYCIDGKSLKDKIIIDKFDRIITKDIGDELSLQLNGECPNVMDENLIGIIHFHLPIFKNIISRCYFSSQDYVSFGILEASKDFNPNKIEINAIQCGKSKLKIIDNENLKKSLRIKII